MLQTIEALVAKFVILKYVPTRWLLEAWHRLTGYRSYIFAIAWLVVYVFNREHISIFADDALSARIMEVLVGSGAAALLEKFKAYLPVVNSIADGLAQKAKLDTSEGKNDSQNK